MFYLIFQVLKSNREKKETKNQLLVLKLKTSSLLGLFEKFTEWPGVQSSGSKASELDILEPQFICKELTELIQVKGLEKCLALSKHLYMLYSNNVIINNNNFSFYCFKGNFFTSHFGAINQILI